MKENKDLSKSQLSRIFQMMSLNGFGLGFISIFIPIFLFKLGYSFQEIMVWIMIQQFILLVGEFIAVYFSNKIGLVSCLHIRFVFLLAYLLLLFVLPHHPFLFYIIPIIIGL